jgi:cephalosporin hydroxylase
MSLKEIALKVPLVQKILAVDIFNKLKVRELEAKIKNAVIPVGMLKIEVTQNLSQNQLEVVEQFNKLYYELGQKDCFTYLTSWLGYEVLKCPLDLWMYQEIVCKYKPDLIIETGTAFGGSSLFLASICSLIDHGNVITVDINECETYKKIKHPRVTHLVGSSVDLATLSKIRDSVSLCEKVMVFLDSDHNYEHVLNELNLYHDFIPIGGYLVVEDTNINGHPVYPDFGPGPMEALNDFLKINNSFVRAPECERFMLTMNPLGYLKRIK